MTNSLKPRALSSVRSEAVVLLGLLTGLLLASGCGPRVPEGFVSVTGTVTYEDKPLTTGTILFSAESGAAASAPIDPYGRFETFLRPGRAKVAVRAKEGVDRLDDKGNYIPAKSLIPDALGDTKTSGLSIDVAAGMKPVNIVLEPQADSQPVRK